MTGDKLKENAITLWGEQWKHKLALELKCSEVTVWRYSKQAKVPWLVESRIKELLAKRRGQLEQVN